MRNTNSESIQKLNKMIDRAKLNNDSFALNNLKNRLKYYEKQAGGLQLNKWIK